ncbi:MAG TPA: hemolysin family protein [Chthoniobacterales bacterium]|nr:hemolysin family protein [Chthoniobacterales bacterium]
MNIFSVIAGGAEEVVASATSWDAPAIIALKLLAVVFLVLLNGFFVASEFAIVKVRSTQLDALVARGNGQARLARHVTSHLDAYLSATQLGITLASLGLGWLGEPFLARMIEPFFALANITSPALIETIAFSLAFGAITILHIVLGELAPKSLAIRKAVPTALWISPLLRVFYIVFKPAIWLLNGLANWLLKRIFHVNPVSDAELAHSEEELRLMLDESAKAAQICPVSKEIVANAFEIRRRVVREVMTPRGEVVFLDTNLSFRENLQRAKVSRHTRFPLCVQHFDRTIGWVHIKDMLIQLDEPEPSLLAIKKELVVVPEMLPLERLLAQLRDQQAHLAAVMDEFGSNVGIVTLQHIVAEVIGQLPDEFGLKRTEFQRLGKNEFRVDSSLGIYEMRDLAGLEWRNEDVTTVGGYVVHRLGRLPRVGEQVRIDEYIVTVEQADRRRVKQLRFQRNPSSSFDSDCGSWDK